MDNQQSVQSAPQEPQPVPTHGLQEPAIIPAASQPQESKNKSSGKIILIGLVILIAIAVVTYIIIGKSSNTQSLKTNVQTATKSISPTLPVSSSSATDTQLDKDTQNIDNNIKNLDSDVQSADNGLSDKPVDLSQ
ncbi:MAG TPA: hypothetical protein VLG67_01565 [Candidatus Saccharimonadales bacterium]|nr:hypothetical protein [Candidatus Saccharimonadales bacterium]